VRRLPIGLIPAYARRVRTQLRTSVVAGVAAALVLTLPSVAPASPDAPGRAHARQVLARVAAALAPAASGRHARASALPRTDLTLLLRDLRLARGSLTRGEQATADTYLARPSAGSGCGGLLSGPVQQSAHFCVHYSTGGAGAATPAQVDTTLQTLEEVWAREVGSLGFRPPPADSDGIYDVYLQELGDQGLYGYCAPDTATAHSTSYCVLDNDFASSEYGAPPLNSLRVTAAHEFFHAIQFGYDTGEDTWLMEGSAVWAEEQVYPSINDYLQYLPYSAIPRPRTPADYKGADGSPDLFFRYGAVLFWKFLSERLGTPAIVRRVWEYADAANGSRYSVQAVSAALAERHWSFADAFAQFGVWNTEPPGSYGDRALFPAPAWWGSTLLTRRHRDTGGLHVTLDHLTNAALVLRPARKLPKHTRVRIAVNAPDLIRMPRALVQVRRRDGFVKLFSVSLDRHGDGSRMVSFNPRVVSQVVVTLTNASIRMGGCGTDRADRFSCGGVSADDGLGFGVRARLRLPR
jgi:hypothetical protein